MSVGSVKRVESVKSVNSLENKYEKADAQELKKKISMKKKGDGLKVEIR